MNIHNLLDDSKGDSLSSGSLNKIKETGFNRQVTAQPVSYKNKLHQFEQEFLRVKTMNKSVRSIFSSSSKGTKRGHGEHPEAGSGSQHHDGVGAGSELEKFSDASGYQSGSGQGSVKK